MKVVGVDPAPSILKVLIVEELKLLIVFLIIISPKFLALKKAKIITATNVFAHVDNLKVFMQNIKKNLRPRWYIYS